MGKKKSREPETLAGNDTVSAQSDVFTTIFGDVSDHNAAASSLFSDSNPFKRKPLESVGNPDGGDSLNSDTVDLKQRKRKGKENAENASLGSIEEAPEARKSKKEKALENPKVDSLPSIDESSGFDGKSLVNNEKKETSEGKDVKRRKRKRDEVEKEYEEKKYGKVAEAQEEVVVGQKRKKAEDDGVVALVPKEGFDDENKLLRTVFVGNLPIKVKKKVLIKEFSKFGEIESVRIRSVPLAETKKPRKGAIMLNQINEKADSVHAYIVFKTEQSAEASLAHNMAVVAGNHIRVDRACPPRKKLKGESAPLYDNKRTIFVGNLPFDVKDEEVYQLFCGISNLESSIEAVRVVRDPQFGVGKGIAYVLFKTKEAANAVVKKRSLKLRDRELRLSHARPDATPSKRKSPSSSGMNSTPSKKLAVDSGTPSSNGSRSNAKASLSYQGLRASKSGVQKKVHKGTGPVKMKAKAQKDEKPKERNTKRPAVAARKAKANAQAHKDAGVSKHAVRGKYMSNEAGDGAQSAEDFFGATKWSDIALITSWAVWNDRNAEFHEGVRRNPTHTVDFIRAFILEFQRCQAAVTPLPKAGNEVRWKAPPRGVIKINFDGSFHAASKYGSFGVVGRDHNGQVMGSMAGRFEHVLDGFAAEARAALKAIEWSKDMGFKDVILEGDALTIIKKLSSKLQDLSPIGTFIEEIKLHSSLFNSCTFSHIGRDGNTTAHALASYGFSLQEETIWMEELPTLVLDVLQSECNVLPS
ncbi:hypothetical protein CCACVL1_15074 [Corchorus capsularis]|uniref:RRM domain-containing protein n=1 Tax=Corchorus capsularis TaxID=210143 RepID=A0A1R3I426_COCAP|nr:hypothetical protein CCACVL1_15074 [Corchorus capsularis]